jgi:ketosteroid isomerase-like protein
MTTESANVDILKRAYAEWADSKARDTSCWMQIIADDARLTSLADGASGLAFTRERSGRSDVLEYLKGLTNDWEMLFYRVDEFVAQGDRVVALGSTSWRNKQTGKVAVSAKADVWKLKNGKVVHLHEFYDTARFLTAAQA